MTQSRFRTPDVAELLKLCHRRCCLCHRFCGVKMEIHHIEQAAHDGDNDPDNAMPLCFDCHAEVNHYNDEHPKGRKFTPTELQGHRDQWLQVCKEHPTVFVSAVGRAQAGPLEALLDELEFNVVVARNLEPDALGCMFLDVQFKRATESGSITLLDGDTKRVILGAYVAMSRANYYIRVAHTDNAEQRGRALGDAQLHIHGAWKPIIGALASLRAYLGLKAIDAEAAPPRFRRPCTPSALELLAHLEAGIHVIGTYQRKHKEAPSSHHHHFEKVIGAIESWRTRHDQSPPPGIHTISLSAVSRAWRELNDLKPQVASTSTSPAAGAYLAGVEALKKAISDALTRYRNEVDWQGPVAI